jgi:hypothetical protein
MTYFIDNIWADWFWSSEMGRKGQATTPCRSTLQGARCPTHHELAALPYPFCTYPLPAHVLLSDANRRLKHESVHSNIWQTATPPETFYRIDERWHVAGPELTFLQLANRLDLLELIAVGYEYCGTYAIHPLSGNVTYGLPPATSTKRIERFLAQWPRVRGAKKAKEALACISENSASPMETHLHMRFSLTGHRGGYNLQKSLLNYEVPLNDIARRIYKRGSCRCDIFFPQINLDVEYHGSDHKAQLASDSARNAALQSMGINTLVITKRQYDDYMAMSGIVRSIARMHRVYLCEDRTGYTKARAKLVMVLRDYSSAQNRR